MPPATTTTRRQKEKEDRKGAILSAARAVFFKQGLHRATVDEIAARAAVAKGTVYLYFETKETLLAHLLLEGLDSLIARLEKAYREPEPLTAEDRVRQLAHAYFKFYREEPDYFRLLMAFDRGQFQESVGSEVYDNVLSRSNRSLRWVVRAMEVGLKTGEFSPNDPSQLAAMLWAALNGVLILLNNPIRRTLLKSDIETLYQSVLDTMLIGIRQLPPSV